MAASFLPSGEKARPRGAPLTAILTARVPATFPVAGSPRLIVSNSSTRTNVVASGDSRAMRPTGQILATLPDGTAYSVVSCSPVTASKPSGVNWQSGKKDFSTGSFITNSPVAAAQATVRSSLTAAVTYRPSGE